jgi:SAM-dependent methyltransferase
MKHPNVDAAFAGTIPQLYERYLVPLIFEPYAADLASRVAHCQPSRVLEVAAGTGVVTRQLVKTLPSEVSIMATDLNQPMLDQAAAVGISRPVEWRQADAMQLPFPDGAFDVVVCQFGAMFFPDKARAFSEARRVLRPGGRFLFNVWDRIDQNEFADIVTNSLETLFPSDPPQFLTRIPHDYHDPAAVAQAINNDPCFRIGMLIDLLLIYTYVLLYHCILFANFLRRANSFSLGSAVANEPGWISPPVT